MSVAQSGRVAPTLEVAERVRLIGVGAEAATSETNRRTTNRTTGRDVCISFATRRERPTGPK